MTSSRTTVGSVDTEPDPAEATDGVAPPMTRANDRRRPARRTERARGGVGTHPHARRRRHRLGRGDGGDARGGTREDDGEGARADRRATPRGTRRRSGDGVGGARRRSLGEGRRVGARRAFRRDGDGQRIDPEGTGVPGEGREVEGGMTGATGATRGGRALASSRRNAGAKAKAASIRRVARGDATNRIAVTSPGSPAVRSPRRARA